MEDSVYMEYSVCIQSSVYKEGCVYIECSVSILYICISRKSWINCSLSSYRGGAEAAAATVDTLVVQVSTEIDKNFIQNTI